MVRQWIFSSTYHHGIIVAPLSLWMILQRPLPTPNTHFPSLSIIIVAVLSWLIGRMSGIALIEQLSFVGILIGGVGVVFGVNALRKWAFPLAFLFFMVPFGETIVPFLQDMTATAVVWLLNVFGFQTSIDGILIRTSAGVFEIAEACAGLNFLLAALMISSLYAYLSLRSFCSRMGFVFIAAVVGLVANFVRVFLLVLVATITNMKIAVGPDHMILGLAFYALVFLSLFYIGEHMRLNAPAITADAPLVSHDNWRSWVAITAILPVILISLYANLLYTNAVQDITTADIDPLQASQWRIRTAPENWSPVFVNPDFKTGATYEKSGDAVYVNLATYTHDRPGAEIITGMNRAWDDRDWHRIATEKYVIFLFGRSQQTNVDIVAGTQGRRLAVATAYWRGSEVYIDKKKFKIDQTLDKLRGVNPPGGIVMIAATFINDPEEAVRKIRAFTGDVEKLSAWQARNKVTP